MIELSLLVGNMVGKAFSALFSYFHQVSSYQPMKHVLQRINKVNTAFKCVGKLDNAFDWQLHPIPQCFPSCLKKCQYLGKHIIFRQQMHFCKVSQYLGEEKKQQQYET